MKKLDSIRQHVATLRDGLQQPVDDDIFETVVALQACGFTTNASCAGHPEGGGQGYPYVVLTYPEPAEQTEAAHAAWHQQNLQQYQGLVEKLTAYYAQNPHVPHDLRLVANTWGACIVELRAHGAQATALTAMPTAQRAHLHGLYLAEMRAFTQYLLEMKNEG